MRLKELSPLKEIIFNKKLENLDGVVAGFRIDESPHFNMIYAGILLCCTGETSEGRKYLESTLKLAPNDNFLKYTVSYLNEYGRMAPLEKIFPGKQQYAEPHLLRALMDLSMFHVIRENSIAHIYDFFRDKIDPKKGLHVLDIGIGDGSHLFSILKKFIDQSEIKDVTICAVDPSENMLKSSREYLLKNIGPKLKFMPINKNFQDLSGTETGKALKISGRGFDFVHASHAFHHMPFELKMQACDKLRQLSPYFVLIDLEGNEDLPEQFDPEYVYYLYRTYGALMDHVTSEISDSNVVEGIFKKILLSEVFHSLYCKRNERSDFGMMREQWEDLFINRAKFNRLAVNTTVYEDSALRCLLMIAAI
jgi:ubiquinone/menaquinone biosynthesis C-methylase UbiE